MHALKRAKRGAIPRAFPDHRTSEGRAYRAHLEAIRARLGKLPADADPWLREVGRLVVELEAVGLDLARARQRRRRKDAARLRRQMVPMRTQLLTLERRLEELAAAQKGGGLAAHLAAKDGAR